MPIYRHGDKLIYFTHIPKTGGSTVEELLVEAGAQEALKFPKRLNYSKSTPQHLPADVRDAWIPTSFVDYSFAVVRHPVSRLVSEYHWRKSVSKKEIPDFDTWVQQELKRCSDNPFILDNHIRPQTDFISSIDEVFRLEDGLELPISIALNKLELPCPTKDIPHANKSKKEKVAVSLKTLSQVFEFYQSDYENFGYDADIISNSEMKRQLNIMNNNEKELKKWRLSRITLSKSTTVVVELSTGGGFFKCAPEDCKLILKARDPKDTVKSISIDLNRRLNGRLYGKFLVDRLFSSSQLLEFFDVYFQGDGGSVRLEKVRRDLSRSVAVGGRAIVPYNTKGKNISIAVVAASPRPRDKFDIAIFLSQVNNTGGKTKAMLTLASHLKSVGLKVKIVSLTLAHEQPNFKLDSEVPIEFVQFFGWPQDKENQWSMSTEGFFAKGAHRERAIDFLSNLGAKIAVVPDYECVGFYDFLEKYLPKKCIKVFSDHNPIRATYAAINKSLPTDTLEDLDILKVIKSFDVIHVINPLLLPAYEKETEKEIVYIPNGVERWEAPRSSDSIYQSRSILSLARLSNEKQLDHLIKAFAMIAEKRPAWTLLLLGRGIEEENLRKLIKDNGLEDQVKIIGFDSNVNARFSEAAFYVSSAAAENLSLAYLEAMGTGTPLLTYDGNATARYVLGENNENGFSARDGEISDLAATMDDLITKIETKDPIVLQKAASAYEFTRQFEPNRVSSQWHDVIFRLCNKAS